MRLIATGAGVCLPLVVILYITATAVNNLYLFGAASF